MTAKGFLLVVRAYDPGRGACWQPDDVWNFLEQGEALLRNLLPTPATAALYILLSLG